MVDQPDLDEFLSALNGFLDKQTLEKQTSAPLDPSYLRFLEIFCRSIGSAEGQLFRYKAGEGLQSIVAFGIPQGFEKELNQVMLTPGRELSPLDVAFRDQQVVAVVELKRGSGIPFWFMDVLDRYKFKSLIAVPLVGQEKPVGILCAYYRDVCLFDKGTVDRLMTVGRMVGAATEKSLAAGRMESMGANEKSADEYLRLLTTQTVTTAHIYAALVKIVAQSLMPSGVVCGPVRVFNNELVMTVAEGFGVPPAAIAQRFSLPSFIAQEMILGQGNKIKEAIPVSEWGSFGSFLSGRPAVALAQPILWQKRPEGALVAWRSDKKQFSEDEECLMARLAGITSLALQAV